MFYELYKERTEGNEGLKPGRLFCEKVCCRASSCHRLANYLVQNIILRLSRQLLRMGVRLLDLLGIVTWESRKSHLVVIYKSVQGQKEWF